MCDHLLSTGVQKTVLMLKSYVNDTINHKIVVTLNFLAVS